jgi:hypothetical protein
LTRRAKSYSDFYHVVRAQLSKDAKKKRRRRRGDRTLEALMVDKPEEDISSRHEPPAEPIQSQLLEASQREYRLYWDQLAMTERHLDGLIEDANSALKLLDTLASSFHAVDVQTSSFQAQCDDLLSEEKRLQKLADEVGTDLHYYAYLDGVTRRLNAPGASRLVDHENFAEILTNTDACIRFMAKHVRTPVLPPCPTSCKLISYSPRTGMPSRTWHDTSHRLPRPCICLKPASQTISSVSRQKYPSRSPQPSRKLLGMPSLTVVLRSWFWRQMV